MMRVFLALRVTVADAVGLWRGFWLTHAELDGLAKEIMEEYQIEEQI
jgi:hypothetical protein